MAEIELAWAAGFFDGEGWVGFFVHQPRNHKPIRDIQVSVNQAGDEKEPPFVLVKLQLIIPEFNLLGPYRKKPNEQHQWRCQAHGLKRTMIIFEKLQPNLCPVKVEQFEYAIYMYQNGEDT